MRIEFVLTTQEPNNRGKKRVWHMVNHDAKYLQCKSDKGREITGRIEKVIISDTPPTPFCRSCAAIIKRSSATALPRVEVVLPVV